MANNLLKLYGFDRSIPEFYSPFGISNADKVLKGSQYKSTFAPPSSEKATLMGPFLKALALFTQEDASRRWALGKATDGSYVCELQSSSRPELVTIVQWDPADGKAKSVSYDYTTSQALKYSLDKATGAPSRVHSTDATALCLCMMQQFATDTEAATLLAEVKKLFKKPNEEDMKVTLGKLCDNFYQRCKAGSLNIQLGDKGNPEPMNMAEIKNSAIKLRETFYGTFEQVGAGDSTYYVDIEPGQYNLGIEWSAEEAALIPKPYPDHLVPRVEKRALDKIYRTWDLGRHAVRIILLEGPPGSGKSQMARDMAYQLGLPFREMGCSDGTTEESLTEFFVPEVVEASEMDVMELLRRMPSEAEVLLAPEKAYERLTGKAPDEQVTKDAVIDEIKRIINSIVGGLRYKKHRSPLEETILFGGLGELGEPGSMVNPQALTFFNSLFNSVDGTIDTPSGTIKRHPHCVIVATNNPPEAGGYKGLDKAVRNRFQSTFYCPTPDTNEMIDRVCARGFLKDEAIIEVMVSVLHVLETTIEANGINGFCGMRDLFDWARDISFGDSVIESMMEDVINGITTDQAEQELLLDALHDNTSIFELDSGR